MKLYKSWDKLVAYSLHGEVEIDNNLVENSIRPLALGRKNYLFAGSHESAQRSAMFYSLLGTCKLHNINPYVWLTNVYQRIKDHPINRIAELLPQNWKNSKDTTNFELISKVQFVRRIRNNDKYAKTILIREFKRLLPFILII
ncbi:MAG: transposase [Saprospiraceae bacterium]|nr:transposase [Saprospiraceae bacterium]HRG67632.1 transposase [Saprospiraceae bacterium]